MKLHICSHKIWDLSKHVPTRSPVFKMQKLHFEAKCLNIKVLLHFMFIKITVLFWKNLFFYKRDLASFFGGRHQIFILKCKLNTKGQPYTENWQRTAKTSFLNVNIIQNFILPITFLRYFCKLFYAFTFCYCWFSNSIDNKYQVILLYLIASV